MQHKGNHPRQVLHFLNILSWLKDVFILVSVPASCRRLYQLSRQVHPSRELHRDSELGRQPRSAGLEDQGSGLHHVSVLSGGPAAGLLGAASRVSGGHPAAG